ncbi:peptide MFS transporter [Cytophagaceae bacterium ABcell3]|nr:peptide MFS transporter [Cytophagaceae bacterium ABcell3]
MSLSIVIMIAAWIFVIVWIGSVIYTQRNIHPRALFILFIVELWERFSYYGMRSLLVLYMINHLAYRDDPAYGIYGAYGALVYATPVLGGIIADKFLGYRKSILLGAILMAFGHFALAFEYEYVFFLALGFLIIGNGFFKPNISSLVGRLYPEGDPKKDSAFTLFYMGINTGAFLAPLTCGAVGEIFGWHYGFGLAGIGMVLGLVIFIYGNRSGAFGMQGLPPLEGEIHKKVLKVFSREQLIYILSFLSVPLFAVLVNQNEISSRILMVVGASMIIYLFVLALKEEKVAKERLFVILILFFFTTMFWTFFELAGSSLMLFTDRNVDREVLGFPLPASIFQSVNPLFIILLAPAFAALWSFLGKRGKEPSAPLKFSTSLIQLGLGFGALVLGAQFAGENALVPLVFLILAYLLHTTGELCISPIGLSLVTKLSATKIVAFVMGIWFLSSSFAHLIGAEIAKLTSLPQEEGDVEIPLQASLSVYTEVFGHIAWISIVTGIFLIFLAPQLKRWMHGVK